MKKLIFFAVIFLLIPNIFSYEFADFDNVLFAHHSTGALLIDEGNLRPLMTQNGFYFWDTYYEYFDYPLTNPDGVSLAIEYGFPNTNLPSDWRNIFSAPLNLTTPNNAISRTMANHESFIFKMCYPACDITSDSMLQQYYDDFYVVRNFIEQHPEHFFVVFTPAPRSPSATTSDQASRCKIFSDFLTNSSFAGNTPNFYVFGFYDLLAELNPSDPDYGMLKEEYRRSVTSSHPNLLANQTIAPIFASFFADSVNEYVSLSSCTNGQTQSCTTSQSCPGTQTCVNEAWGTCTDIPDDGCPAVIPICVEGLISSQCYCDGTAYSTGYCCSDSYQTIPCGAQCTTGQTQSCTTSESCPGIQSCVNSLWGTCNDIANDGCPVVVSPVISVLQLNPVADINVNLNESFVFSSSVTCSGVVDCGNISVVLDPEVVIDIEFNGKDTYLRGLQHTGTDTTIRLDNDTQRILMEFDVSGIPVGSVVSKAEVWVYANAAWRGGDAIAVYEVLKEWGETASGWNAVNGANSDYAFYNSVAWSGVNMQAGTDYTSTPETIFTTSFNSTQNSYLVNITSLVQKWVNNPETNHGVMLKYNNYDGSGAIAFYSKNDLTASNRPNLNVTYSEGNIQTKNQISTVNGAVPFYTTDLNPQTCVNLLAGETCTNTWNVIPTGNIGDTYSFFVSYTPSNSSITPQNTQSLNLTIDSTGTSCTEEWTCSTWSECINGNQTRTCLDNNDCGTTDSKPYETQTCSECTQGQTKTCISNIAENCLGTQTCSVTGTWNSCLDIPGDNCPVTLTCAIGDLITESCYCGDSIFSSGYCCEGETEPEYSVNECVVPCTENWSCSTWSTCINNTQTRTCSDLSACGTTEFIPNETQSCISCINNDTRSCITLLGCSGTQTCLNNLWGTCTDIPTDNCPAQCTTGATQSCTTTDSCPGTQSCINNLWATCIDIPADNCPICIENWICTAWSTCLNGNQTRSCSDESSCQTTLLKPSESQSCGTCTTGNTQNCTTNIGCSGTQTCSINNIWSSCSDTLNDNCPCIENWTCTDWSNCLNQNQTRSCSDESSCQTTEFKPSENQSCGECTTGEIKACTTNQGCNGTQTCTNSFWGNCSDITNDGCPSTNTGTLTNLKEFTVSINPTELTDALPFVLTVTSETNPLQNTKISYAGKTYYTNTQGQVTLKTNKDYPTITLTRTDYKTQIISLNIKTKYCGNLICDQNEAYENCPQDCSENLLELKISTKTQEGLLTITITSLQGKPIENVQVKYGTQTKNTDAKGITKFTELEGTQTITISKQGYKTKTLNYNSALTCKEETTQTCITTENCEGTQTCVNGNWSSCEDIDDSCPVKADSTTTTVLAAILVIGIIALSLTKMKTG